MQRPENRPHRSWCGFSLPAGFAKAMGLLSVARSPMTSPLKYTEYIDGCGTALFQRVCELDLEGIVAKQKFGPYVTEREHSTWFKILNREYSQKDGKEELFERERHQEPVPGWHSCVLACVGLEAATRTL
ncbi:MAG: hypothetical protein DMG98_20875 [Acidobacteria bacterium]|nr:MAG: hypothetical protein DMG98_20875 [Acidobacteriota bacterium]